MQQVRTGMIQGIGHTFPQSNDQQIRRMRVLWHCTVNLYIDTDTFCDSDHFIAGIRLIFSRDLIPERT